MRRIASFAQRRAVLVAGLAAGLMVASCLASAVAIFALHLSLNNLLFLPTLLAFIGAGWLLAVRRPDNVVGWLLLMTALGLTTFVPGSALAAWLLAHHVGLGRWIAGLSGVCWLLIVGGLALLLPLTFPDGKLPSRRRWWRIVLLADVTYMAFALANAFEPGSIQLPGGRAVANPLALPHQRKLLSVLIACCIPPLMVGFTGSFGSIVVRWRGADSARRAQMKWAIAGLVAAPLPFILHDSWQWGSNAAFTVVLPLVPICFAVSVLRYRLYEIDRILSRAVSYLLVTGSLLAVYLGCVALLTTLLPFASSVGVAASTLAAAALFRPVRRRVQHGVDRRFNRQRYDAGRVVDRFATRLRDAVDPDVVHADLLGAAATAIQPTTVSLWLAS